MIVVADSSPLSHLVRIGHVRILSKLFGNVLIPTQVAAELAHRKAPKAVRAFIAKPPGWLGVRQPDAQRFRPLPRLDPGEEAAINLAYQEQADLLLMDEKDGRAVAKSREWNIPVTGTLGVLEKAAHIGLLDLREALKKLSATKFHLSQTLVKAALEREARRKSDGA